MQQLPLACFLSLIRPPGVSFEDGYLQILPVDKAKCPFVRDSNDITFRLYTRHNPIMFQELKIDDDEALFASHMDFHDPTVIYFSAFLEQPDDGSGLQVRESYMLRGDTNFIILDLSRLEAGPWYFTAAENTWYIGNFAAKFIDYLVSRGLDLKKTHLVGHSLGAQSAGVAGSVLKSGKVSRITGLDPAFPLFDKLPLSQRLDPSDADFVDVIHTDAGIFGTGYLIMDMDPAFPLFVKLPLSQRLDRSDADFVDVIHTDAGFNRPTGHADFYPNGGISPQPGCELEIVLHEQRLLNKCEGNTQPHGYYKFTLTTHDNQPKFEDRLRQYFLHIRELKEDTKQVETPTRKLTAETKLSTTENKEKLSKLTKTKDKNQYINDKINEKELIITQYNAHKREKRVSTDTTEPNTVTNNNVHKINTPLKEETINIDKTEKLETNKPTNEETKNNRTGTDKTEKPETNKYTDEETKNNKTIIKNKTVQSETNRPTNTKTTTKRSKRFISIFRNENDDNFLFKMLEFLTKHRRNILPVVTVMREINTLVKNGNGELSHVSKERNNFIGALPQIVPIAIDLDIGGDSKVTAFVKKLLGLGSKGGRLSVTGRK